MTDPDTAAATEMLDGRVRALIERTERAETALRNLWSSLAWQHLQPHTAGCGVCKVHDEVRSVLRGLNG